MTRPAQALLAAVLALGVATGCATGRDAVAVGGQFQFVAPKGQQIIHYDPPANRGQLRGFAGESLLHPPGTVGVDDYPDAVVVLNIWGSWCGVCRPEMRDLQVLRDNLAGAGVGTGAGVAVLGLDIRDGRDAARDFLRGAGVSYDSIYDQPGRVLSQLDGYPRNVVPSTILLDRQHRVAAVYLTRVRLGDLTARIDQLRAEPRETESR